MYLFILHVQVMANFYSIFTFYKALFLFFAVSQVFYFKTRIRFYLRFTELVRYTHTHEVCINPGSRSGILVVLLTIGLSGEEVFHCDEEILVQLLSCFRIC